MNTGDIFEEFPNLGGNEDRLFVILSTTTYIFFWSVACLRSRLGGTFLLYILTHLVAHKS